MVDIRINSGYLEHIELDGGPLDIAAEICTIVDAITFVLGEKFNGTKEEKDSVRKALKHSIIAALKESETDEQNSKIAKTLF